MLFFYGGHRRDKGWNELTRHLKDRGMDYTNLRVNSLQHVEDDINQVALNFMKKIREDRGIQMRSKTRLNKSSRCGSYVTSGSLCQSGIRTGYEGRFIN